MDTTLPQAAYTGGGSAPKGQTLATPVKDAASACAELGMPSRVLTGPALSRDAQQVSAYTPAHRLTHGQRQELKHPCACTAPGCSAARCGLGLGLLHSHWLRSQAQGSTGLQNDRRTDGQTTSTGQALAWAWPCVGTKAWATGSRSLAAGQGTHLG